MNAFNPDLENIFFSMIESDQVKRCRKKIACCGNSEYFGNLVCHRVLLLGQEGRQGIRIGASVFLPWGLAEQQKHFRDSRRHWMQNKPPQPLIHNGSQKRGIWQQTIWANLRMEGLCKRGGRAIKSAVKLRRWRLFVIQGASALEEGLWETNK